MDGFWGVLVWLVGLAVAEVAGFWAADTIRRNHLDTLDAALGLTEPPEGRIPAAWVGRAERVVFFTMAFAGTRYVWSIAVGWLALKLAANWGPMIGSARDDMKKSRLLGSRAFGALVAGALSVGIAIVAGVAARGLLS